IGVERSTEAAAAFAAALEVRTRDQDPLCWAVLQNNPAAVLVTVGQRSANGRSALDEAISTVHAALEVLSEDRTPAIWAMAEYTLGQSLSSIGELDGNAARYREAIAA